MDKQSLMHPYNGISHSNQSMNEKWITDMLNKNVKGITMMKEASFKRLQDILEK